MSAPYIRNELKYRLVEIQVLARIEPLRVLPVVESIRSKRNLDHDSMMHWFRFALM
jgi:hypothetical protein